MCQPVQPVRPVNGSSAPPKLNPVKRFVDNHKVTINGYANGLSLASNLLIFLNLNLNVFKLDEETQEKIGNFFVKTATGIRGIAGAVDCYFKNCPIPMIGFAMEPFVSIFCKGFDHWVNRGTPQGINQMQSVYKRRGIEFTRDGATQRMSIGEGDHFNKYGIGMMEALKLSVLEYGKIWKEVFSKDGWSGENKTREKLFTKLVTMLTTTQTFGAPLYWLGLKKTGAGIRDLFGALVDVVYLFDKPLKDEPSYVLPGVSWILSGVVDWVKRIESVSSRINGLTQLSSCFDGVAGIYYGIANFGKRKDTEVTNGATPAEVAAEFAPS